MTPDVIQFSCPACQSLLTVPAQLAGVSGPCPKCGQTVTSPPLTAAAPPAAVPTFPAPTAEPAPVPASSPAFPPQPPLGAPPANPAPNLPTFPPAPAWASTPPPAQATLPVQDRIPGAGASLPPRKPPVATSPASLLNAEIPTPPPQATSPSLGQSLPSLGGDESSPPSLPALGGLLNQNFSKPSPETPPSSESVLANVLPSRKASEPPPSVGTGEAGKTATGEAKTRQPLPPFPNRPSKSSSLARLSIALVLLLGALGLLAFFFASPLRQIYYQYVAPKLGLQEPTDPEPSVAIDLSADQPSAADNLPALDEAPKPDPAVTAQDPSQPEVIQKAEPALPPGDTSMPKIEPLKPDAFMEVPQAPAGQEDPDDLNLSPPPSFATVIPDEAKPAADALVAFLMADTLEEKRKYILGAEDPQVANLINRYYGANSPTPIPVTTIGFIRHDPNPEVGGGMQSVFMVASPDWKYPIPVMLQETKSGIKLDWIAFTEFKDDWLFKFVETFRSDPARFHVSIRRGHYFDRDVPDLENKHCFFIQPPQEHFEVAVFVPKNTPLADMLGRELSWGTQNAYVLAEIQWRDDGQFKWVELTAVPQLNWHITIEPPPVAK